VSARFDSIVLGATIDGLAAACTLAKNNRSVLVIDELEFPGGAAAGREFYPGFRSSGIFPDALHVRRKLLAPLNLESHGLEWRTEEPPLIVPTPEGGFPVFGDPERMLATLSERHPGDAQAYEALQARLGRYAPILQAILDEEPPDPTDAGIGQVLQLGKRALSVRLLGERDMHELFRLAPLPAADWMNERFECEALKTGLVAPALLGTQLGPRAAGTAALQLLRGAARGAGPVGGPAALVDALVQCLKGCGGELRLGDGPRAIELNAHAVEAVTLAGGDRIETPLVLSALDPKRTLLELLAPTAISSDIEKTAVNWRMRGSSAVLLLALSRPLPFERAISARSLRHLEQAADHLKYGRLRDPIWIQVDVVSPSSRTDGGEQGERAVVATLVAHGVPHGLRAGWDDAAAETLESSMLEALEGIAPGAGATVLGRELLTPPEIERRFSLPGAHPFAGELSLDQLWLQRPGLALSRYRTPLPGLYLGSAANHPGGPFLGGAGVLAARAALRA